MKHYVKKFLIVFIISLIVCIAAIVFAFVGAILGFWGNADDIDLNLFSLDQNSVIVYIDPSTGEEKTLHTLTAEENREWVDIEKIPADLQNAFISIEDERFLEHNGYDLLRTAKATFTYIGNKITGKSGVSLGGSTITQQLIKNVTGEDEQTPLRKMREISRAVSLEKQLEKTDILELYLNCIYLSQGCNGVQTAANTYFGKDVSELNLAECACIAGITQNPAAYDPLVNPNDNKERQEIVLGKMLELGHITQEQYNEAKAYKLQFSDGPSADVTQTEVSSYFVDQVVRDVVRDLQEQGYSQTLANKMVYSGGLKIYAAYNPEIQTIVEEFYKGPDNFAGSGIQSAITVIDVQTGQVVGIAGGIGEKTGNLTLNRASQSPRQPGSTIKPIAAYAPAVEFNYITPGSIFADKAKSYDGWTPRNYDYAYRGNVDVRRALRTSLNTVPVEIISRMGAQTSYDFLKNNLGVTTLVESRDVNGKIYSDIGLSQLALGGLTDGMTTLELAAAYVPFANGGQYYKPHTYTDVVNKDGKTILSSDRSGNTAMKPSTAYTMTTMLREVVTSGTGGGASVSGVNYTAGKTGTTSDNKDRWFVGYTPYYVAAIWYGYDTPKEIYASNNPCIPVFRNIMNSIHETLDDTSRTLERPDNLISVRCCTHSAMRATSRCPGSTYSYFESDDLPAYCNSNHAGYLSIDDEEEDKEEDEEETTETEEDENAENSEASESTEVSDGTSSSGNSTSDSPGTSSSDTSSGTPPSSAADSGGTSGGSAASAPPSISTAPAEITN